MKFGLIGRSLQQSYSKLHFSKKFQEEGLPHSYELYELESIDELPQLITKHQDLRGLNVTIPYKVEVIPFLDTISDEARQVGAVNTIKFSNSKLYGYNTDVWGFEQSLKKLLKPHHHKALILGTGGASKAVGYVLKRMQIDFKLVSRNPVNKQITYTKASKLLEDHFLIINTTPAGTYPEINEYPPLSFRSVDENHLFYDLVYNPEMTTLLKLAAEKGAATKNGMEMLQLQAERAWEIWQEM